ncbi:MAG: flagellar hook assembly protein FlgD [Spirochaetes bacterium]|nr:flagellar hook assembly protein FlgD [Spirochaetota bacterium]
MDLPLVMSEQQRFTTELEVERFNKALQSKGKKTNNTLGKDEFLKLLVVQLENQDPTEPVDDKEFIAQLAQFSSLEQMTQMNTALMNMIANYKTDLSYSLLGKRVEVVDRTTGETAGGVVTEVSFNETEPVISFNGLSYGISDVAKVSLEE